MYKYVINNVTLYEKFEHLLLAFLVSQYATRERSFQPPSSGSKYPFIICIILASFHLHGTIC